MICIRQKCVVITGWMKMPTPYFSMIGIGGIAGSIRLPAASLKKSKPRYQDSGRNDRHRAGWQDRTERAPIGREGIMALQAPASLWGP